MEDSRNNTNARILTAMRAFLPSGIIRANHWKSRFERIGLSPWAAWRAAFSQPLRNALVSSRIEHLPPPLRTQLRLVVDVGANLGQWVSAFRQFVSIDHIEIFEPNPEAFEVLSARFSKEPSVHLHKMALGDQPDMLTLNVTRSSDLASFLSPSETLRMEYSAYGAAITSKVQVPVTTLDATIQADAIVDLLKIDVQGFERAVLRGAPETLKNTRALLIEMNFISHYQGDETFGSLFNIVTNELGFKFWDIAPPHRSPSGRSLWCDAVFINPNM